MQILLNWFILFMWIFNSGLEQSEDGNYEATADSSSLYDPITEGSTTISFALLEMWIYLFPVWWSSHSLVS